MTLDSLPDLDTSGLCLVKTLSTALTCWPFRNMALRDGARTSTRTSSVAKGRTASIQTSRACKARWRSRGSDEYQPSAGCGRRPWYDRDRWNVEGDFDEVRSGVDRLASGEGQPGQRDVRWTPMKEEQAVGAADLGHQIRKMSPNRGATLSMTLDGMQTRLDGPAAGALNIDVTLACLCHAPHDLDVFPLRELLDQLPRLLTKSLVDRTQLTQVPVGFVALTHFVPKLRRDVAMAGLELAV